MPRHTRKIPYAIQQIPSDFINCPTQGAEKTSGKKRKKRPSPEIPIARDFYVFSLLSLSNEKQAFRSKPVRRKPPRLAIGGILYSPQRQSCIAALRSARLIFS